MKVNSIVLTLFLVFCILPIKSQTNANYPVSRDLTVELGAGGYFFKEQERTGSYEGKSINYILNNYRPYIRSKSLYTMVEMNVSNHIRINAAYRLARVEELTYTKKSVAIDGQISSYDYFVYFHSLSFGAKWYSNAAGMSENFTFFTGLEFLTTYSYDYDNIYTTEDYGDCLEALNFAIAPSFGFYIPIVDPIGIKLNSRYVLSVNDIILEGNFKRDFSYFTIDLGVVLSL